MKICGKVWKFGADVDTDAIIPGKYLNTFAAEELAKHCMEGIDPDFVKKMRPGDLIVADSNFGCGSSREHAPIAIQAAGVSCVIARSFARIFYRNAINIGLPILEVPEAYAELNEGDTLDIDFDTGVISNLQRGKTYRSMPYPEFMQQLIASGGLMAWVKERMQL